MGVFTSESEVVSLVSPATLFKALSLDFSTVFPKALPNIIKKAENIEGDGGAGTIKKFTFPQGYAKQKVDAIDYENYVYHYSVIEGGALSDSLEKISYEYKLEAAPNGGSIIKSTTKYYTKGDKQLTEEYLKAEKQKSAGFFKSIGDYLLANPDYN